MTNNSIVVQLHLNVSPARVWSAITNVDEMKQWFFSNIPDFKAEVGFRTQFNVNSGERNFLHQWEVTKVIQEKMVSYTWQYEEYEGLGEVQFELRPIKDGTQLYFTMDGIETFDSIIPEFTRESCLGGWNYFLNGNLKTYIESKYS